MRSCIRSNRRGSSWVALSLLFASAVTAAEVHGQSARSGLEAARRMVADQAAVEFGSPRISRTDELLFAVGDVRLDSVKVLHRGIAFWRGTLPALSHSRHYVVALLSDSSAPLRLGGFESPQVDELAVAMRSRVISPDDARQRAEILATAADPHGAVEVVAAAQAPTSLAQAWQKVRPASWPSDTSVTLPDGRFFVSRTMLSRNASGYSQSWVPIRYSFLFGQDGTLAAWRARVASELRFR